jgi:hypothetical protein
MFRCVESPVLHSRELEYVHLDSSRISSHSVQDTECCNRSLNHPLRLQVILQVRMPSMEELLRRVSCNDKRHDKTDPRSVPSMTSSCRRGGNAALQRCRAHRETKSRRGKTFHAVACSAGTRYDPEPASDTWFWSITDAPPTRNNGRGVVMLVGLLWRLASG